jgi:hypothetical protein
MANTAAKPKTEPRTLVAFVVRVLQVSPPFRPATAAWHAGDTKCHFRADKRHSLLLQIVFCIVCLALAANWSKAWHPFKSKSWQVYIMLESVSLAVFASVTGLLVSAFFLFAPRLVPSLAE